MSGRNIAPIHPRMGRGGFEARVLWGIESLSCSHDGRSEAALMGQNGRAVVEKHFDRSIVAQRIAHEFGRLV